MKKKQAERLLKRYVLAKLSGWIVRGDEIIALPVKHLYCAFGMSGSSYDQVSFYLESMIAPLYVPDDILGGALGERIDRKGDPWELVPADREKKLGDDLWHHIKTVGLPWMEQFDTVEKLARNHQKVGAERNTHVNEAIAGAAILSHNLPVARKCLNRAIDVLTDESEGELQEWYVAQLKRVRLLQTLLDEDMRLAKEQLLKWEQYTIKACKLESLVR
jgi:hypothetical protein